MKYKVRVEYRAQGTVEVEAESAKEAEEKGIDEADGYVSGWITVYSVDVEEQ